MDSTRTLELSVAPSLLMLTLLRFAYADGKIQKLMRAVSFTEPLTLPVTLRNPDGTLQQRAQKLYKLFAVIVHSGQSATHGHYYSFCRNLDDGGDHGGAWQLFNDASVRVASLEEITSRAAPDTPYVLLFRALPESQ